MGWGSGVKVQQLWALAALPKALGSISGTHMAVCSSTSSRSGILTQTDMQTKPQCTLKKKNKSLKNIKGRIDSMHIHLSMHSYRLSMSITYVYIQSYTGMCICSSNIRRGYITVMLFLVHQMVENSEYNVSHCPPYGKQAFPLNTELNNTHPTAQARTIPYKMHKHVQFQLSTLRLGKYSVGIECL